MSYPLYILDVFAEAPLSGNQLGVVLNAGNLSAQRMLDVARELNFSETTFVTGYSSSGWRVRIFTPQQELPFAGHPSLGTAWVLHDGLTDVLLDLAVGPVTVTFELDGRGWIQPPRPQLSAALDIRPQAAAALSLPPAALADLPVVCADVGPQFVLIPLADAAALARAVPDVAAWDLLAPAGAPGMLFAFTDDTAQADVDIAARMFFRAGTVREDPATGSANACLARYLQIYASERHPAHGRTVVVAQGDHMLRPSRLYLDVGEPLRVGGRVIQSVRGELQIDPG